MSMPTRRFVDDDDVRIEQHHLSKQELLLVAAGQLARQAVLVAEPDVEILDRAFQRSCFLVAVEQRAAGKKTVKRRQGEVDSQVFEQQQSLALAVFGQIDDTGVHAGTRVAQAHKLAGDPDFAAAGPQTEQSFEQLGAPRADQAGKAQYFTLPRLEGSVGDMTRDAESFDVKNRRPTRWRDGRRVKLQQIASHHHPRHVDRLEFAGRPSYDMFAIAQHRDAVGDGLHLLQAVRDIKNGHTPGLEIQDQAMQRQSLDGGQWTRSARRR